MSSSETLLLGAIAGATIFIGLPVGRIRNLSTGLAALFNAASAGVLVFLLIETAEHAFEPVEEELEHVTVESGGSWAAFVGKSAIFAGAIALGLLSLVYYERWMKRRGAPDEEVQFGPGTASVEEYSFARRMQAMSQGHRLALFIAVGIGLHNFAEGLSIGQSAANDDIQLAVLLVIGFAVHNATEGFGIVAPLAAEGQHPSWGFLALMGTIGGAPTFVGTLVGQSWVNDTVSMAFLALAAGSILYVIVQLLHVGQRLGHRELLMWGLFGGLMFGFGTELVLVAAGV